MDIGRTKVKRPQSQIDSVAWKAKIPHCQFFVGVNLVQGSFPMVAVLHAFTQSIANQADVVSEFKLKC
jgi:hypothetical protein